MILLDLAIAFVFIYLAQIIQNDEFMAVLHVDLSQLVLRIAGGTGQLCQLSLAISGFICVD
jgi:hypothetical protein